jgi:hypothetical protein
MSEHDSATADQIALIRIGEISSEMQTAGGLAVRIDTTVINKIFTANAVFRAMIGEARRIASPETMMQELSWYEFLEDDFEPSQREGGYLWFSKSGCRRLTERVFQALGVKELNFSEDEIPYAYGIDGDKVVVSGSAEAKALTVDDLRFPLFRRPSLRCDFVVKQLTVQHEKALASKDTEIAELKARLAKFEPNSGN